MSTSTDAAIQKIRACFKLADPNRNPSEHEAAAALAAAKRLMALYNLEEADILEATGQSDQEIEEGVAESRLNPAKYETVLAQACAHLFSVRVILAWRQRVGYDAFRRSLLFVGYPRDLALAREVFAILRADLDKMALSTPYRGSERDQWYLGVAVTLYTRAKETAIEQTAAEAEKCRALVVRKFEAIDKSIGPTRSSRGRGFQATSAYQQGKADGRSISLDFGSKLKGGAAGANQLMRK